MTCLESINSLYVEKEPQGYIVRPCCLYDDKNKSHVDTLDQLLDNPVINKIRQGFKTDWKANPACNNCLRREEIGLSSKRLRSIQRGQGLDHWDIRPGHTCNLKCAMCSPKQSSKWLEDLDVYSKYSTEHFGERSDIDWNWLYDKMVNTAKFVYIAGGEPFYMKEVHNFLDKLGSNSWNAKNTIIQIQTNCVSNTKKFLDILAKFKKLEFSLSIDGWEEVNELIRFPTKHETFVRNADELFALNPIHIYFNITSQAMNLPVIDKTVNELTSRWNASYDLHTVTYPEHLQINALKPHVVQKVAEDTKNKSIHSFLKKYEYNEKANKTMQSFLLDLDKKRGTNSPQIIPWCFE